MTTATSSSVITIYSWKGDDHFSGISGGDPVEAFVDALGRHGHAITDQGDEAMEHSVSGFGVAHVETRFAEGGVSMAAYYENAEGFSGSWWDDERSMRAMFGREFAEANR